LLTNSILKDEKKESQKHNPKRQPESTQINLPWSINLKVFHQMKIEISFIESPKQVIQVP
jgi:hypothetical protein